MARSLTTGLEFVKYSGEIAVGSLADHHYLGNSLFTSEVRAYLNGFRRLWTSAVGVLGASFYDIAQIEECPLSNNDRPAVKGASSNFVMLTELVDNIIDGRLFDLRQKNDFLDEMLCILFEGFYPPMPHNDTPLSATYQLALYIQHEIVERDRDKRLERICRKLVLDSKEQFWTESHESDLICLKRIGQGTTATSAVMSEIFDGRSYCEMMEAARSLGEYFELRDAYADIEEDLREGTPTYFGRIYIEGLQQNKGDKGKTKRELKRELLDLISDSFNDGISHLREKKSRDIYSAMKLLVDVKYRLSE
jgi:hypothetical protein